MSRSERLAAAAWTFLVALAALDATRLLPFACFESAPPACLFHAATGLPCPGCGMARGLLAALEGRWGASLSLHPLALPLLAVWTAWLAWGLLNLARGRGFSRGFPDLLAGARGWAALGVVLSVYAWRLRGSM